jgi:hypothetical protein
MSKHAIADLWEAHSREDWPQFASPHEGQLMTLDTVIGGCAVFYLDGEDSLDRERIAILKDCLSDLDGLLEELEDGTQAYFQRLRLLAAALIQTRPID